MWERTEVTSGRLLCNKCGELMTAEWEEKNEREHKRSTVYHCENCDNDVEYLREFDNDGRLIAASIMRYFFG